MCTIDLPIAWLNKQVQNTICVRLLFRLKKKVIRFVCLVMKTIAYRLWTIDYSIYKTYYRLSTLQYLLYTIRFAVSIIHTISLYTIIIADCCDPKSHDTEKKFPHPMAKGPWNFTNILNCGYHLTPPLPLPPGLTRKMWQYLHKPIFTIWNLIPKCVNYENTKFATKQRKL